jgi:hypothetical protein
LVAPAGLVLLLLPLALSGCSSSTSSSSQDDAHTIFVTAWTNQSDSRVTALLTAIGPPKDGKDTYQGHVQYTMEAGTSQQYSKAFPCQPDMVRVDVEIASGSLDKKKSFPDVPCGVGSDLFTNLELTVDPAYNITVTWN